jgi:hypothetical protein
MKGLGGFCTNLIKPCPSKSRTLSARELLWDVESQASSAFGSRAATFKHLDDLESAVGSRLLVKRDGELAGATVVNGGAFEVEKDSLVDRDLIHSGDLVRRLLAGEVGSAGLQGGCVEVGDIERHGEGHFDVGARHAAKGHDEHGADHGEVGHARGDGGSCCVSGGDDCCWKLLRVVSAVGKTRPASQEVDKVTFEVLRER